MVLFSNLAALSILTLIKATARNFEMLTNAIQHLFMYPVNISTHKSG